MNSAACPTCGPDRVGGVVVVVPVETERELPMLILREPRRKGLRQCNAGSNDSEHIREEPLARSSTLSSEQQKAPIYDGEYPYLAWCMSQIFSEITF